MKRNNLRRLIISVFLNFMLLTVFSFNGLAADEYVFERMWPVLEQPWYFYYPKFIAANAAGNVYVADSWNHRIQKFTASGAFIGKWGKKGTGDGELDMPFGIAIDGDGNVYVAEWGNHRIQKFSSSGAYITKWGSEGTGNGEFNHPIGISIDAAGNVYVSDTWNHRIQKFSATGVFISKWGSYGTGNGKFYNPIGIAFDGIGNVYVADMDNHRIQKFTSSGVFISKWGSEGTGDGEFNEPCGISTDVAGNVYVADQNNNRIQKFTSSGGFIAKWGSYGEEDGQFNKPCGTSIDSAGNVYVADVENLRIQKFSLSGAFISNWDSAGAGDGVLHNPDGIAIDDSGNVYVTDRSNHRIQKFSSSGVFISKWGGYGSGDGAFNYPGGLGIDGAGNVYVAETGNHRIQKFTSSGVFISKWGRYGSGDGTFNYPADLGVDSAGNVYVVDTGNHRIQKFSSSGAFISKWGSKGTADGEFDTPFGISIDSSGNVYVADWGNHRIQKFSSSGVFISKWGSFGEEDGQFNHPVGISTISMGDVYVVDTWNHRVQQFTSDGVFITKYGKLGSDPGLLNNPTHVVVNSKGKIYISESANNRVQVLSPSTQSTTRKAIIVAGSGPYSTNELWDATQMCANYAYRALTYQGYTRDTIYYLSADTDLDLDNDGYPDVDADATNANLEYAIKTWAQDADNLFIYMVGHGGEGTFVTGEFELLNAADLDAWLDAAQQSITDYVALVYDGCHSGSFVSYLVPPAGKKRIVAVSTAPNEPAIFEADGGLSFGYQFFSYLFNGGSFYDSFVHAKNCVEITYDYKQSPQIEGDGNGIGNEKTDKEITQAIKLGNETKTAGDIPRIQSVSPAQTLAKGETSALIYAQNVVDADGIQEVFAVIKPPDYSSGSSNIPVTDLPTINLTSIGNNSYSGIYDGFTVEGVYNVAVFARDGKSTLSLPVQTSVTVPMTTDCLVAAADLSIQFPCAEYDGNPYAFTLVFYPYQDDPSGLYWKMVLATFTTGAGTDCIPIGSDLSIPISCVAYDGVQYGFTLRFYNNQYDPSGLYWKVDMNTLVVK